MMYSNKVFISPRFYYTVFRINNRIILAPCEELKKAQRYFLNAVKWEYRLKIDTYKTVQIHTAKKWILKMDIKDFYNSVPYSDIEKFIRKVCTKIKNADTNYYLNLVTVDKKLPTGAPTSAHIANACFKKAEDEIRRFCNIYGVDFSRFMDDLTFSSNNKKLLQIIEKRVKNVLFFYGYKVNSKKTKYISQNKQQKVLGLIVNNKAVCISNEEKRKIRAALHNYVIAMAYSTQKDLKHHIWTEEEISKLSGKIAYIKHVDYLFYIRLRAYNKKLLEKYKMSFPAF